MVLWALGCRGLGLGENYDCLGGSSRIIKGNVRLPAKDGEMVVCDRHVCKIWEEDIGEEDGGRKFAPLDICVLKVTTLNITSRKMYHVLN